ncbi:MAG: twin-arginine translocase subunit TatC [Myxococcota bacterium]
MSTAGRSPEPEPLDEVEQYRMPLIEHLRELRNRLMYAIAAAVVGFLISLAFVDDILHFVTAPVTDTLEALNIEGGLSLVNSPFEGMQVWLNAALIGAVTLSSPVIAYQVWAFVAPGLYQTERKYVAPLAFSSTALFLAGAGFAYYVIFPVAFPFFFTVVEAEVSLSIEGYLNAVLKLLVAFGACFQLPVGAFFLARLGLIDGRDMIKAFRYSVVGIFVVAALITPPDVLSQLLLAAPLMVLYFVSVGVAWMFSTKVRE